MQLTKEKPTKVPKKVFNPRQQRFLALYLDPKSDTRGNALQSALKAGFKQEYAEVILNKDLTWVSEGVGKDKMLEKAERNLDEFLDLDPWITQKNKDGDEYKKYSSETLKVKADVTKFVAGTVGRLKYGSKDPDGGSKTLIINITGETASRYGILKQPD